MRIVVWLWTPKLGYRGRLGTKLLSCLHCGNMYIIWVHQGSSLWNHTLWGLLWRAFGGIAPQLHPLGAPGGPLGVLPLNPALWGLLWRTFIQDHIGAPRGQPLEPCPLGALRAFGGTSPQTLPSGSSCRGHFGALLLKPHPLGAPVKSLSEHCPENLLWRA